MKRYEVEYGNCKVGYKAETLDAVAREYGIYGVDGDHDYMHVAVKHFCFKHFMYGGAAHIAEVDAATRGDCWQSWKYEPNGSFSGWINARVVEG